MLEGRWRPNAVEQLARLLLDSDDDESPDVALQEPILAQPFKFSAPLPEFVPEPDQCSFWDLDRLQEEIAADSGEPSAAEEPQPEANPSPEQPCLHLGFELPLGILHSTAALVERYLSSAYLNPRPPTLLELRGMLTHGPARVLPFQDAAQAVPPSEPGDKPARGAVVGVSFNIRSKMYDAYASLPTHVESRAKLKQVYCGGSAQGFREAARLRDSVVVQMYRCGTRWSQKRPAKLNFPPEDALELLTRPRAVPMGFREYADYLQTEVADKRSMRAVEGFRGVYAEVEADLYGEEKPRGRVETGRLVAAVFDPEVNDGVGARRLVEGDAEQGAWKKGQTKWIYWRSAEQAARAYDREVIKMGGLLIYRLNYALTDYPEELMSSTKLDEVADELMRFVAELRTQQQP